MLNIGQVATTSGVSAKMIRHYEAVGLLPAAQRTDAGYRQYGEADVRTLRFIRHSRDLGFSIPEIGRLVGLWQDRGRPSREVKALAKEHIRELEAKAKEILAMKSALEHLVAGCRGDKGQNAPSSIRWRRTAAAATPMRAPGMFFRLAEGNGCDGPGLDLPTVARFRVAVGSLDPSLTGFLPC